MTMIVIDDPKNHIAQLLNNFSFKNTDLFMESRAILIKSRFIMNLMVIWSYLDT